MAESSLSDFFEPEDEKMAFDDAEQQWYFDLPSGAWERQEQKSRELRRTVKQNAEPGSEEALVRPASATRRSSESWQSTGGTWALNPAAEGDAEVAVRSEPMPLRVARRSSGDTGWMGGEPEIDPVAIEAPDDDGSVVERMRNWSLARKAAAGGGTGVAAAGDDQNAPPTGPLVRRQDPEEGGSLWGGTRGETRQKRRILAAPMPTFENDQPPAPRLEATPVAPPTGGRGLWMGEDADQREPAHIRVLPATSMAVFAAEPEAAAKAVDDFQAVDAAPVLVEETVESPGLSGVFQSDDLEEDEFEDDRAAVPLEQGGTLAPLPLMRRAVVEDPAEDEAPTGEPKSRWDEVFAGQAVGGGMLDAMREWILKEQEEEQKSRDITLLPPELLQPFDWETDDGDPAPVVFAADGPSGESVASLAGHIWAAEAAWERQPETAAEPMDVTRVADSWSATRLDEAPGAAPDVLHLVPESATGDDWGGSAWPGIAPADSGRDDDEARSKKQRGLLGRLFGKGVKGDSRALDVPEWTGGEGAAWTTMAMDEASMRTSEATGWLPVVELPAVEEADEARVATAAEPRVGAGAMPPFKRDWDDGWFEQPADVATVTATETPEPTLAGNLPFEGDNPVQAREEKTVTRGPWPGSPVETAGQPEWQNGFNSALHLVPPPANDEDPWATFIAARDEEEAPFRFASESDARRSAS